MEDLENSRDLLQQQISATETQLEQLKLELARTERQIAAEREKDSGQKNGTTEKRSWPFTQEEYQRYGRQMIVDQIGLEGQIKLRDASVLIVGAGGLGCPSAMYLAGAGVGTIGIVDGDTVEQSNLHRQVLHRTRNVRKYKVDSAIEYLQELNPHPKYTPYRSHLTPQEAPDIFAQYDIILDCTDNPATRYLISDTAVLLQKVLVSASALRTDGQLMVLNYPNRPPGDSQRGPCYRCVFPKPPPAASVVSCADGGILGPVVGLMGVMQALEAIRVVTNPATSCEPHDKTQAAPRSEKITPSLHLFSAYSTPPFRSIKLRPRRANCAACSGNATITLDSLRSGSTDYVQFCGSTIPASLLSADERISAAEYKRKFSQTLFDPAVLKDISSPHVLLDVRERIQYDICSLDNSINVPMSTILGSQPATMALEDDKPANGTQPLSLPWLPPSLTSSTEPAMPIYVVCRLGNDSQVVVRKLKELGLDVGGQRYIGDIKGGLRAWRNEVDPELPDY